MGAHEFVRRRAHVHSGVMKHEIFELHEFACAPQGGAGVMEMRAKNERFGDVERSRSSKRARASGALSKGACRLSNETEAGSLIPF
jgi:hypothetical protein